MNITIEKITPKKAEEFLSKNHSNRSIRVRRVNHYANEMLNCRWSTTLQGISFFEDGTLADGQHRLLAIIKSGVTLSLPVARGLKREAMAVIDTGAKRNVGDFLALHHGVKNSSITAAAIGRIVSVLLTTNYTVSGGLSAAILESYRNELETVISYAHSARWMRRGWLVACLAIALKSHPEFEEFIRSAVTGEGLEAGDPALVFRNWVVSVNTYGEAAILNASKMTFTAAYHFINGNKVTRLVAGSNGLSYFRKQEAEFIESLRGELILS